MLSLIIMDVVRKPLTEVNAWDNLILLPIILIFSILLFDWFLKKRKALMKMSDFMLVFILSQIPISTLIAMNNQQNYKNSIVLPLIVILLIESILQYLVWKKQQNYIALKTLQLLNKQLHAIYQEDLSAYLIQKDQEEMYHKLRHDLLNEITMISLLENKAN